MPIIAQARTRQNQHLFSILLGRKLQIFNYLVAGMLKKIRATYELPVASGGLALGQRYAQALKTAL
jgi:hypothetical protein